MLPRPRKRRPKAVVIEAEVHAQCAVACIAHGSAFFRVRKAPATPAAPPQPIEVPTPPRYTAPSVEILLPLAPAPPRLDPLAVARPYPKAKRRRTEEDEMVAMLSLL
jgi:hypothetical protein